MPLQFRVHVPYGDGTIEVTADTFAEIHEAAARLYELERDAAYLRSRGAKHAVPDYHLDGEKNAYYGWREHATGKSVTFGQNKEKGLSVPFFPKGEAGYWEPEGTPQANGKHEPAQRTPADSKSYLERVEKALRAKVEAGEIDAANDVLAQAFHAAESRFEGKELARVQEQIDSLGALIPA